MREKQQLSSVVATINPTVFKCLSCNKLLKPGKSCFAFKNITHTGLRQRWRQFAELPDSYEVGPKDCLCIDHFRPELISTIDGKKRLKPGSVPTIKTGEIQKDPAATSEPMEAVQFKVFKSFGDRKRMQAQLKDPLSSGNKITHKTEDQSESSDDTDSDEEDEEIPVMIQRPLSAMMANKNGGRRRCVICDCWMRQGESAFSFPVKCPQDCQYWMDFAKLPIDYELRKSDAICAKHFVPEDFTKTSPLIPHLIPRAVPSIFDPRPRIKSVRYRKPPKAIVPKIIAPISSDAENIKKFMSTVKKTTFQRVDLDTISDIKCCVCLDKFATNADLMKKSPYSGRLLINVFENMLIMKMPPAPTLCSSCLSMIRNFDKFQSAANQIRDNFRSLMLRRDKVANSTKVIKETEDIFLNDESDAVEQPVIDWEHMELEDAISVKSEEMSENDADELESTDFSGTEDDEMAPQDAKKLESIEFADIKNPSNKPITLSRRLNLIRSLRRDKLAEALKTEIAKAAEPKIIHKILIKKPTIVEPVNLNSKSGGIGSKKLEILSVESLAPANSFSFQIGENQDNLAHPIRIPCEICGKLFREGEGMDLHHRTRHIDIVKLPKSPPKSRALPQVKKKRVKKPWNPTKFPCEKCGKLITGGANMEKHLLSVHEADDHPQASSEQRSKKKTWKISKKRYEEMLKCTVCGAMRRKVGMWAHMLSHSHVNRQVCPMCPYNFASKPNLKHHIIKCHAENYEPVNRFICTNCTELKVFNSIDELRTHMEDTHNIKQIPRKKKFSGTVRVGEFKVAADWTDVVKTFKTKNDKEGTDFEIEIEKSN